MAGKIFKTITLQQPIKVAEDIVVDKLEFTPLTAGDMEDLTMDFTVGMALQIASSSTGVPLATLREMSSQDTLAVYGAMKDFFEPGQQIGSD